MDRTWVHGRQFTPAYMDGVANFMEYCSDSGKENAEDDICHDDDEEEEDF